MNANKMMRKFFVAMGAMAACLSIAGCPVADPALDPGDNSGQPAPAPQPTPPAPRPAPLLVITNNGGAITEYENPAALNGNIAPKVNLLGAQTGLVAPYDSLVNAAGQLFAANVGANSVTIYNDARQANGNLEPSRNIAGAATGLTTPTSIEFDEGTNTLLAANYAAPSSITIYANASNAEARGNLQPIRKISSADLNQAFSLSMDADRTLYVGNFAVPTIAVFNDAPNLNGTVAANRVISSVAFTGARINDVLVDSNDILYVVLNTNRVLVFSGASNLNGSVMPDSTLVASGAVVLYGIAVDSGGIGYLADLTGQAILVYDDIATRNGTFAPDRTIKGADTQLRSPIRLSIVE